MHSFSELVIGDVFVAPFIVYAVTALAIFIALRPILHLCQFGKLFTQAQPQRRERERKRMAVGRRLALRLTLACFKRLTTLAIALVAIVTALVTWDYYVTAPWTRDGRVRVQVASVAPQVSGRITELRVGDNQYVYKGDVLYVIDPFDFEVALRIAKAHAQQKAADLQVKQLQSERRQRLSDLATTPEEQQKFAGSAVQAKAEFDAAQQEVAQAEVNLRRTQVRSPVNGHVTNLLLRVGDFAHQGGANVSVVDADSYWIDGYFEETKLGAGLHRQSRRSETDGIP
jgi:multidrug resistance efflux pump